ncbi:MAG: hypothetical protein HFI84_03080 [Eubacterium sp.]|nr:hypothetical protein [Eubacterium sp.]
MLHTVFAEKVSGCRIDHNSMFEKDLSSPVRLGDLYSVVNGGQMYQRDIQEIPKYLGQGTDITENPLYKYLNEK